MKTHSPLKYYREQQELLNDVIPQINKLYNKVDKFINDDKIFKNICRWSDVTLTHKTSRVDFCFTSKEEHTAIKNALNLNKMTKKTSEQAYTMTAEINGITIRFFWNLPDTCEVIKEYDYEETHIAPEDLKIDHIDKRVLRRVGRTISIKCGDKSMLESVFSEVN